MNNITNFNVADVQDVNIHDLRNIKETIRKIEDINIDDINKNTESPSDDSSLKIENFTRNLTKIAETVGFDPFLGRSSELNQIISVLVRKKKNNVILLGEPGVGKTAIVEGLTTLIYEKSPKIPKKLYGKEVYEVNVGALTAGAKYRGEYEERIEFILKWVKNRSNVILFIDEIHVILGGENFNASNYIKPSLARSDFLCIGATTEDEFEHNIAKDKALMRRFKNVIVGPLSTEATIKILRKVKREYENHYEIKISKEVFREVVDLSELYIKDQFLPDKALDLLDLSCSQFYLNNQIKLRKLLNSTNRLETNISFIKDKSFEALEENNLINIIYFSTRLKTYRKGKPIYLDPIFYHFYILYQKYFLDPKKSFFKQIKSSLLLKQNRLLFNRSYYNNIIKFKWEKRTYKEIMRYISFYYFDVLYHVNVFAREFNYLKVLHKFWNFYNFGRFYLFSKVITLLKASSKKKQIRRQIKITKKRYQSKLFKKVNYKLKTLDSFLSSLYFSDLLSNYKKVLMNTRHFELMQRPVMSANYIGQVLSKFIKIPINPMFSSNNKNLLKKQDTQFNSKIFGQPHVLSTILNVVKRSYTGIRDVNRPISSFFFSGPTGVGKTEVAKVLAEILFGNRKALTIIDMSDYPLSESISKLIGTSPGYVGYEQGGLLTDQVRKHPYSIIVFDEIEKAAKSIYNLFLQILEEGRLVDNKKRSIDFTNTIIIFTSNIGANLIIRHHESVERIRLKLLKDKLGSVLMSKEKRKEFFQYISSPLLSKFVNSLSWKQIINSKPLLLQLQPYFDYLIAKEKPSTSVRLNNDIKVLLFKNFRPEIINRIDHILVFNCLAKNDIRQILDAMLTKLAEKIYHEYSLLISCSASFCNYLVTKGYDVELGARPLRRILTEEVENRISEYVVEFKVKRHYKNGNKKHISKKSNLYFTKIKRFSDTFLKYFLIYRKSLVTSFRINNDKILSLLLSNRFAFCFFSKFLKTNFNYKQFSTLYWNSFVSSKQKKLLKRLISRSFSCTSNNEYLVMSDLVSSKNIAYIDEFYLEKY